MNKIIIAVIIALIGGIVGYFVLTGGDSAEDDQSQSGLSQNDSRTTTQGETASPNTRYTLEDVAQRNNVDECWTVIDGAVYDITEYIPNHPGGASAISLACGADGTRLFTERVDEDGQAIGSGSPHSAGADNVLQRYRIGITE